MGKNVLNLNHFFLACDHMYVSPGTPVSAHQGEQSVRHWSNILNDSITQLLRVGPSMLEKIISL